MLEGEWSKALNSLLFLTVRCFYVVQKQKGVADAMIKADYLIYPTFKESGWTMRFFLDRSTGQTKMSFSIQQCFTHQAHNTMQRL